MLANEGNEQSFDNDIIGMCNDFAKFHGSLFVSNLLVAHLML